MVQHFRKLISLFHKNYPEMLIETFLAIDSALPMTKPIVKAIKSTIKRKQGQLANNAKKQTKKNWIKLV